MQEEYKRKSLADIEIGDNVVLTEEALKIFPRTVPHGKVIRFHRKDRDRVIIHQDGHKIPCYWHRCYWQLDF